MQTVQKTTGHRIMDDKVVSETNDTKVLRCRGSKSRVPFEEQKPD